jgi:hypothetical protein
MGALISMVGESLARLGRARLETDAARLAEEQIRALIASSELEDPLELSRDAGTYEPPHDMLRWELTAESYGIPLAEEFKELANSSSIFESNDLVSQADPPSLRRVILRIFLEDGEQDIIDPFVVFTVEPLDAGEPEP